MWVSTEPKVQKSHYTIVLALGFVLRPVGFYIICLSRVYGITWRYDNCNKYLIDTGK